VIDGWHLPFAIFGMKKMQAQNARSKIQALPLMSLGGLKISRRIDCLKRRLISAISMIYLFAYESSYFGT
jgi:hypothetical protein